MALVFAGPMRQVSGFAMSLLIGLYTEKPVLN